MRMYKQHSEDVNLEFLAARVEVRFLQLIGDDLGVRRTWIMSAFHRVSHAL